MQSCLWGATLYDFLHRVAPVGQLRMEVISYGQSSKMVQKVKSIQTIQLKGRMIGSNSGIAPM